MARAMALATVTRLPLAFFSQLVTPSFSSWGCGSIRRNLPSSFSESKRGLGWETSGNCSEERAVIVFLSQQSDSQPEQKTVVETVEANSSFLNKVINHLSLNFGHFIMLFCVFVNYEM